MADEKNKGGDLDGRLVRAIALKIAKALPSEQLGTDEYSLALVLALTYVLDTSGVTRDEQKGIVMYVHDHFVPGEPIEQIRFN